jgi:hypothetical protein
MYELEEDPRYGVFSFMSQLQTIIEGERGEDLLACLLWWQRFVCESSDPVAPDGIGLE